VRALLIVVAAVAACDADPPPPAPPPRVQATATQKALDECRDTCEQNVIVTQAGDAALRSCRAGCDARYPAPPHEVPSRITRSAPTHAAPSVRPR
jgi:hypothetical protein